MPRLAFSGQHADEELQFVFRRHIIAMRKGFYGLLIPLAIGSVPFLIWQDNVALLWLPVIGLAIGFLIFFYHWIGWYFSIFIVTNERIRQASQHGLFGKTVIDLNLDKVQNISYNIPGFWGEFLGFGTIVLQTIVGDMVIAKVAHCEKVYNQLAEAIRTAGGETDHEIEKKSEENSDQEEDEQD